MRHYTYRIPYNYAEFTRTQAREYIIEKTRNVFAELVSAQLVGDFKPGLLKLSPAKSVGYPNGLAASPEIIMFNRTFKIQYDSSSASIGNLTIKPKRGSVSIQFVFWDEWPFNNPEIKEKVTAQLEERLLCALQGI